MSEKENETIQQQLLIVQKPLAMQVQTLCSTLELIQLTMPEDMFKQLIKGLENNINQSLMKFKTEEEQKCSQLNDLIKMCGNSKIVSHCST